MKTLAMKLLLGWLALATPWLTQDNAKVTIRGNLTSPRQSELPIDFNKLKPQLIQQIDLPSMPAPAAIASMTTEQRRAWFDSFRETQSGKEYFAERQRLLDNRIKFEINVKDDGSFILVDVPQGSYRLTGKVYEESGGQAYTFEISEQVNVSENKPVQLGKLPIVVTRSLRSGEAVPTFELARFDDPDKTVRHTDFEDSFLLVYFWGLDSELSLIELSSLEELREKLSAESANVEFLGICLDEKTQIDGEFLRYRQLDWHASSGGWQGDTVEQFGVRKLPYYCLVNPKGKVVVSNELFRNLFQSANMNLEVVIRHVLAGKDMQDMLDAAKGQGQNK